MSTGLLHLLQRSAELLELHAEELRAAHTIGGRWPEEDEYGARRDFNEMRDLAKHLRKAHKYHKPNPLGGPAKMFDAIADRIRAGDSLKECMADYGMRFKRSNAKAVGLDAAGGQSHTSDGLCGAIDRRKK